MNICRVLLLILAILGQALGIGEQLATGLLLFAKRFLPRARYATIPLDLVQPSTILSVTLHHRATLPHHSDWSIIGEQARERERGGDHLMPPSRPCQQFLPPCLAQPPPQQHIVERGPMDLLVLAISMLVWQIITFWLVWSPHLISDVFFVAGDSCEEKVERAHT